MHLNNQPQPVQHSQRLFFMTGLSFIAIFLLIIGDGGCLDNVYFIANFGKSTTVFAIVWAVYAVSSNKLARTMRLSKSRLHSDRTMRV